MSDRARLINRNQSIAELCLESVDGPLSPQQRRGSIVIILIHDRACRQCRDYVEQLVIEASEFAAWDAALAAVPMDETPNTRLQEIAGITSPGVVIADQWADIVDVRAAGDQHDFPSAQYLIDWVRYLAIQCPECEGESL